MKLTIDLDVEGYDEGHSITEMINMCVEEEVRKYVTSEVRASLAKRKEEIKMQISQATEAELIRAMQLLKAEKAKAAKETGHC